MSTNCTVIINYYQINDDQSKAESFKIAIEKYMTEKYLCFFYIFNHYEDNNPYKEFIMCACEDSVIKLFEDDRDGFIVQKIKEYGINSQWEGNNIANYYVSKLTIDEFGIVTDKQYYYDSELENDLFYIDEDEFDL